MILGDPIYVIEPHSDDAFLSLGWTLRTWIGEGRRVGIVTVHSAETDRAQEAKAYASAIGATWLGLDRPSTPVRELFRPGAVPALPDPLLPEELRDPSATRLWPLGLEHPEHVAVAEANPGDPCYVDVPYLLNERRQEQVDARLRGRTIERWVAPPPQKWDDADHFPSQAALFTLYPVASMVHVPEIIVTGGPVEPAA